MRTFLSSKKAFTNWALILAAALLISTSIEGMKQENPAYPVPRPTVDKADSRILWQFDTGG
jgi:hypothetical protein